MRCFDEKKNMSAYLILHSTIKVLKKNLFFFQMITDSYKQGPLSSYMFICLKLINWSFPTKYESNFMHFDF
jgi:hypothetical protein